jgi:hypothetical protein
MLVVKCIRRRNKHIIPTIISSFITTDQQDCAPARGTSVGGKITLLGQFLNNCQRKGWLSTEERQLLIEFKLEGISGPELARRNGHSVVAIRHRIQRLLDRLRRIAQSSGSGMPQQLNLLLP